VCAKCIRMLKPGDRVFIEGTHEEGTVKEVHPHEALVRVRTATGSEERRYPHESLRLDPTMNEATGFIDR